MNSETAISHHHHTRYRPHIDGLRAIAVMGVVLFHFGAKWLPGGFVGVDVFFVISGFVISKSLYRDIERGDFSIVSFYERRARRIMPAFFVVTAMTSVAAYFMLLTTGLVDYAKSVIAASTFVGNIYFYFTSGYFAPSAIQIPLLHYWSLGVEEQFYVFFPLIVMAAYRWRKQALPWIIGISLAASLIACEIVRQKDPALAFYLLPFRAFELLIGCGLALKGVRFPTNRLVAATLVGLGIILVLGGMVFIDETMPFPGLYCLPACLGAALVIYGGDSIQTAPSRLLGWRPFLFVGAISYSLYLVHWPIVVFVRLAQPSIPETAFLIGGVAASILLAWLSFALVETPFRLRTEIVTRGRMFAVSAASILIFVGISVPVIQMKGFPDRLTPDINRILGYQGYSYVELFREGTCFLRPEQTGTDLDKPTCLPQGHPNLVLWGDSSIAQYYWGMAPLLQRRGIAIGQMTASGCPPILNINIASRPKCTSFNDFALAEILKTKPDTVVLGAVWVADAKEMSMLDKTIAPLVEAGIKVVVIGPPSYYNTSVPIILATRRMVGNHAAEGGGNLDRGVSVVRDVAMRAHFAGRSDMKYISVNETVCSPDCTIALDDVPVHFDIMHLTREGSDFYASKLVPAILE